MTQRATEDLLSSLHGALARTMQEKLESGTATASDLNVIRQFLKDNGIDAWGEANGDVQSLAETFDFPVGDDDDEEFFGT